MSVLDLRARAAALLVSCVLSACGDYKPGPTEDAPPVPTASLSAETSTIQKGQSATLNWSSTGASYCRSFGSWSGDRAISGSATIGPFNSSGVRTFILECNGEGGFATQAINIAVADHAEPSSTPPTLVLAGPAAPVRLGQTVALSWSTTNATACTAFDMWSGAKPTHGTETLPAFSSAGAKVFTLSCSGPSGLAVQSVVVSVLADDTPGAVAPLAPANLSATSGNEQVDLSWTASAGAVSYELYQSTAAGLALPAPIRTGITGTSVSVSGLVNGTQYFYVVKAINARGASPPSNEVLAIPTTPSVARATLAPGVRVLTDAESSRITVESDTVITVSGEFIIAPGTTFLTSDSAFVAVSSTFIGGNTRIVVRPPEPEEIISELSLAGTAVVQEENAVASQASGKIAKAGDSSRASIARSKASVSGTIAPTLFLLPFSFEQGGMKATGSVSSQYVVDYSYDWSDNELKRAQVNLNLLTEINASAELSGSGQVSKELLLKPIRIPIKVTVYDHFFSLIGFRVFYITIPMSIGVTAEYELSTSAEANAKFHGTGSSVYKDGNITNVFDISPSLGFSMQVDGTGKPINSTQKAELFFYLNAKPALGIFSDQAVLAGLDLSVGPYVRGLARIVDRTPPYCLSIERGTKAEGFAFYRIRGTRKTSTKLTSDRPYPDEPNFGSCSISSQVLATVDPASLPATFFQPIKVNVTVSPVGGSDPRGKIATGKVEVELGLGSCETILDVRGQGSCTLPAGSAGIGQSLLATYKGDTDFEPSQSEIEIDVGKANTVVSLSAPYAAKVNTSIIFTASVAASPSNQGPQPTGNLRFVDSAGTILCSENISSSSVRCNHLYSEGGTKRITVTYSGDQNYLPSTAAGSVTITAALPACDENQKSLANHNRHPLQGSISWSAFEHHTVSNTRGNEKHACPAGSDNKGSSRALTFLAHNPCGPSGICIESYLYEGEEEPLHPDQTANAGVFLRTNLPLTPNGLGTYPIAQDAIGRVSMNSNYLEKHCGAPHDSAQHPRDSNLSASWKSGFIQVSKFEPVCSVSPGYVVYDAEISFSGIANSPIFDKSGNVLYGSEFQVSGSVRNYTLSCAEGYVKKSTEDINGDTCVLDSGISP